MKTTDENMKLKGDQNKDYVADRGIDWRITLK
jgi:hypothetical protein